MGCKIIKRLPMGRRVCRWRARAACLRGRLRELHLCVATNELGNSNASIILYALLLRLSACDCPERGQGKSRQDCWDAFHLLPAYQKLHHPTPCCCACLHAIVQSEARGNPGKTAGMPSIFSLRTRNSIIRRLPMGRRVCRWRARAACLRGRLRELHLCVATNELGNSNASIILYALLLRLSACDRPERGQGKSRQDCWDAFHLLPAYQKLHHPTVTHGPKGVQMEGKGRLPQRRAMGTTPVCGHERAGQQQCQHHPVCLVAALVCM
ncbi:uncharacterized protein AAGF69_008518 isoform 2-T7 [Amazona ochrocephala]